MTLIPSSKQEWPFLSSKRACGQKRQKILINDVTPEGEGHIEIVIRRSEGSKLGKNLKVIPGKISARGGGAYKDGDKGK